MIKSKHKIISVVLCAALLLCSLLVLAFPASAATGDTVYARKPSSWSKIYCYMWKDGSGSNANWPGVEMTATSESGVYSYNVPGDYNMIIFNNGSSGNGNQTNDLSYSNYNGYICDLTSNSATGSWSVYDTGATSPTTSTDPTNPTNPTDPSGGITVYLKNSKKWSSPYCYMWNGSGGTGNQNSSWAGEAMTLVTDDIWMYHSSTVYANVIFSNTKSGNDQTGDLTAQNNYIFDNQSNSWEVYDPTPIRIQSYTADPATNIYTGTEVTLSAAAASDEGTVKYKFSVNGTTIRDFATGGTTTWTPTTAGSYTVTFDFKDTAGNTNTRTLDLTVASDSGVAAPIIKKVTPAANGYVQKGQTTQISVTAGGGQTGTNLLFYKYTITDPSNAKNTPYYTLNSTYSYNFSKEGTYNIEVSVQASDNTTVTKSFTVTSTSGSIPTDPTEPTESTEPTQQTQPTDDPYAGYQLGDVNMDGYVNINDATYIQMYLAEYANYDVPLVLGDMNKDGVITIRDVTSLQRKLAHFT